MDESSTVIGDVLRALIGHVDNMTVERFVIDFSTSSGVPRRTVRNWLAPANRRTEIARDEKARKLADYFKSIFPGVGQDWFQGNYSVKEIEKLVSLHPEKQIAVWAGIDTHVSPLDTDVLPSVYETVRFSFETDDTSDSLQDESARQNFVVELLRIKPDGSGSMSFEHHFPTRVYAGLPIGRRVSRGPVLPMGECYFLVGTHRVAEQGDLPRPRAYIVSRSPEGARPTYRYGIILSTSAETQRPCAARMILRRLPSSESWDTSTFLDEVSRRVRFANEHDVRGMFGTQAPGILLNLVNTRALHGRNSLVLAVPNNH